MNFYWRLLILLLIMGWIIFFHYKRKWDWKAKVKDYSYFFAIGLVGAFFNIALYYITIKDSPEYFLHIHLVDILTEGTQPSLDYAFHSGFVVGALMALLILFFANFRFGKNYRKIVYATVIAIAVPLLFTTLTYVFGYHTMEDFLQVKIREMGEIIDTSTFAKVWVTHVASYIGTALGVFLSFIYLWKQPTHTIQ